MSKEICITDFKNKLVPFLSEQFLFKSFSDDVLKKISEEYEFQIFEFESGEKIYSPNKFSKKVGFVFSGECLVEKERADGNSIPLNSLIKNDSFGILAVFSNADKFPTCVKAKKRSTIVFLEASSLISLIKDYSEFSLAVIEFMSKRIEFLNEKITAFSADSVEQKLAHFILKEYKSLHPEEKIVLNLSKTAKALNVGRASIYRTLNVLEAMKIIKFENKNIHILDFEGLERITQ